MIRYQILAALGLSCVVSACGMMPKFESPVVVQARAVTPASDRSMTLSVTNAMVFYDQSAGPTRGIRFPPGTYTLEAEDESYWYLHAAAPVDMLIIRSGQAAETQGIPGGIELRKAGASTLIPPAAGYIDGDAGSKVLTWRLGGEFMRLEGKEWTKSF